jgi:serine/threonine protein kinase
MELRNLILLKLTNIPSDLHPGNILLTEQIQQVLGEREYSTESVLLCDFGQSKALTETSRSAFSSAIAATRYRAPELARKGAFDTKATDVFAAGIFVFDVLLLAAKYAGDGNSVMVPRGLWKICQECISQKPDDRPSPADACIRLDELTYGEVAECNYDLIDLRLALRDDASTEQTFWSVTTSTGILTPTCDPLSHQSIQASLERFF